jgi:glycosyltransferase involved in cell wall biosynthesis
VVTRYFARQSRFYTFSWPLTRWLARHTGDYDLVHVHALFSYSSTAAALFARRRQVPYVVRPLGTLNRWGMANRRPWLKIASFHLIERRILAGAAAIHFTSEAERIEAGDLGVDGHSAIIALGIDLHQFQHLPSPDIFLKKHAELVGRTIVLYMSRLDAKKGLDLLLPAFAEARKDFPNAALVIAGSGTETFQAALHQTAQRLGLDDSVVMTGFLDGEDKRSALAAASLFVLPSRSENFGVACVEAMAAGLPVVLSNQVAVSREVLQADAGLIVDPEVAATSAALKRLLSDATLRDRLGGNARQLAANQFSSVAAARRVIGLYEQLLLAKAA